VTYAALLAQDLIFIYLFDEYEPKFGKGGSSIFAAIGNGVLTLFLGAPVIVAVEIGRRSKVKLAAGLGVLLLAFGIFSTFDTYKSWAARRAVRHVYMHNSYVEQPFTRLQQFEQPIWHLWLHGFPQLTNDPWGRPFHYESVPKDAKHPHLGTWNPIYVFWSDGPDGRDDGYNKHDDIDITNSMY
jgi:hypothetical protein